MRKLRDLSKSLIFLPRNGVSTPNETPTHQRRARLFDNDDGMHSFVIRRNQAGWTFPLKRIFDLVSRRRRPRQQSFRNNCSFSVETDDSRLENDTLLQNNFSFPDLKLEDGSGYVVITLLSAEKISSFQNPSCCYLVTPNETLTFSCHSSNDSRRTLWHAASLLSDILILELGFNTVLPAEISLAITAGFRQRVRSGYSTGRMLILLKNGNLDECRERLVMEDLRDLTPVELDQLDIIAIRDFPGYLQELMGLRHDGTHSIIDLPCFPRLFMEAVHALGENNFLLEASESETILRNEISTLEKIVEVHAQSTLEDTMQHSTASHIVNTSTSFTSRQKHPFASPINRLMLTLKTLKSRSQLRRTGSKNIANKVVGNTSNDFDFHRLRATAEEQEILGSLHVMIQKLETLLEDKLLDPGGMPIDFAYHANPILDALASFYPQKPFIFTPMANRVKNLFQQHMQQLRDHYGRMFETMLDHSNDSRQLNSISLKVVESFRSEALRSIPMQARKNGSLRDLDLDYIDSLAGLSSDIERSIELRRDNAVDDTRDSETESKYQIMQKRLIVLCKKMAAKALMLGINYLQGWLAWQAIKRAALEREQSMPKFPLY
jgi:hypothetical protein